MSDFLNPKYRALDSNGDPISGAKLNFYETGTSTPQNTYPTAADRDAATNANANPVVADSDGYFGRIYLETDTAYRVQLTDASDVQIWQEDNVDPSQMNSNSLVTRVAQIASSAIDFGAVGDGVADESSELQSAINAATGAIDLLGKTYRCDSQITLSSGQTLKNGTLDFSSCTDTECILIQGSAGTPTSLTADSAKGDSVIDVTSASGMSAGDIILVDSQADWDSANDGGELCVIESISVNALTVHGETYGSYTTANSAQATAFTTVSNVVLDNLRVIGNTSTSTDALVWCEYAENVSIRDCRFSDYDDSGQSAVGIKYSVNVRVSGCHFEKATNTQGLGVRTYWANDGIYIENCKFFGGSQGVFIGENTGTGKGVSRNVLVRGCDFTGCGTYSVFVDVMSFGVEVVDCLLHEGASDSGMYIGGASVSVRGCRFFGHSTGVVLQPAVDSSDIQRDAIDFINCTFDGVTTCVNLSPQATDSTAEHLRIINCHAMGATALFNINSINSAGQVYDVDIIGNISDGSIGVGVTGAATADFRRWRIIDNQLTSDIDFSLWTGAVQDFVIKGNTIIISADAAIHLRCGAGSGPCERWVVEGNVIEQSGAALPGIYLQADEATSYISVRGNMVEATTGAGIWVDYNDSTGASSLVVASNLVTTTTGAGIDLDATEALTGCAISGNVINASGAGKCIDVDGKVTGLAISGNFCQRGDDTDDNIELDGTGAGDVDSVCISGNVLVNGDYGVRGTNVGSQSIHDGNCYTGVNAGDTTGITTSGDAV